MQSAKPGDADKKKINILMVDDQLEKLLVYETILSDLGENLIRASCATEALQRLLQDDIAVALIDVNLPDLDGFQLADLIRQHPRFEQTALIFISALYMTDADRLKGYERGGVDYLSVPVVPEILRAKVKLFVELRRKSHQLEKQNEALHLLSARLMNAQDTERRRIARDLHDSLGQHLAAAKMSLQLLQSHVSPEGMEDMAGALDCVEKCITETRTIPHLLHPPLLDEAGFVSAARLFIENFAKRSGIEAKLVLPDTIRMSQLTEITLFRVLQESLTNVHRHSGSPVVETELKIVGQEIWLTVRDFGCGLKAEVTQSFDNDGSQAGVGLAGMRERVKDLGGALTIRSNKRGTAIIVKLPVTSRAEQISKQKGKGSSA